MNKLCIVLTFRAQVDFMIWARLSVVHEIPHDDGKAVDVRFRRPIDLETDLSQKLGGYVVHLYNKSHHLTCYFPFMLWININANICKIYSSEPTDLNVWGFPVGGPCFLLPYLNSHRPKPESFTWSRLSTRHVLGFRFPWNLRLLFWMNSIP